jgi:hypothetical protein
MLASEHGFDNADTGRFVGFPGLVANQAYKDPNATKDNQ